MITRKAKLPDIPALSILFDKYRVFYEKKSDLAAAESFLRERLQNKESEIFVTESKHNELLGFVQLYPIFSSTRMQRLWLLNDLFVAENQRGKGISVALIDAAKAHCSATKACGLLLETAKTNDIGNQLYPRTGFVLDVDHNYYSWDND